MVSYGINPELCSLEFCISQSWISDYVCTSQAMSSCIYSNKAVPWASICAISDTIMPMSWILREHTYRSTCMSLSLYNLLSGSEMLKPNTLKFYISMPICHLSTHELISVLAPLQATTILGGGGAYGKNRFLYHLDPLHERSDITMSGVKTTIIASRARSQTLHGNNIVGITPSSSDADFSYPDQTICCGHAISLTCRVRA